MNAIVCDACGKTFPVQNRHYTVRTESGVSMMFEPPLKHFCTWACVASIATARSEGETR